LRVTFGLAVVLLMGALVVFLIAGFSSPDYHKLWWMVVPYTVAFLVPRSATSFSSRIERAGWWALTGGVVMLSFLELTSRLF
jgi:hypothetical protein